VSKRLNKPDEMKQLEKRIKHVSRDLDLFQRRMIIDRLRSGDEASPEELLVLKNPPQILRKIKQRYQQSQAPTSTNSKQITGIVRKAA
jgi:hypothetical protein